MSTESKSNVTRKKRRTQKEIKYLIDNWLASKLSQSEFCRREKLNFQTFYDWVKKYKDNPKAKPKSAMSFMPLQTPKIHQDIESHSIEIKFANGVQCRFSMNSDIKQIARLTKELVDVIND
jgi:transposase-like protein